MSETYRAALTKVLAALEHVERLDKAQAELAAESARQAKEQRDWAKAVARWESDLEEGLPVGPRPMRPHTSAPRVVDYGDVWNELKACLPMVRRALKEAQNDR